MLEFKKQDDFTYFVIYENYTMCILRKSPNGWMSDDHDTLVFYFGPQWHRQIADKLDELNKS